MDQGWFVANLWLALALVAVGKDRFPIHRLRTLALAAQFFAKMVSNVASLLPTVRAFAYLGILVRRACGGLGCMTRRLSRKEAHTIGQIPGSAGGRRLGRLGPLCGGRLDHDEVRRPLSARHLRDQYYGRLLHRCPDDAVDREISPASQ